MMLSGNILPYYMYHDVDVLLAHTDNVIYYIAFK